VTRVRTVTGRVEVNRRLVRERDRTRSRELLRFVLYGAGLALPLLGYVWQRVDFLRVSYKVESLEKRRQELSESNESLRVERAHLMDHGRIERMARKQLGMVDPPADGQRRVQVPGDDRGDTAAASKPLQADVTALPVPTVRPR
jgi:cell division protein FtsL